MQSLYELRQSVGPPHPYSTEIVQEKRIDRPADPARLAVEGTRYLKRCLGQISAVGAGAGSAKSPIFRRFGDFARLSEADFRIVDSLTVCSERQSSTQYARFEHGLSRIVQAGWCARVANLQTKHLAVACLILPGDIFGVASSGWAGDRLPIQTLTACTLADASPIRQIVRFRSPQHSALIQACEAASNREQLYIIAQLQRLTAPDAFVRTADFLLEVYQRLESVGLAAAGSFRLPISQATLAEIVGLSAVHLNRILRQFRSDQVLDARRGVVNILDIARLREIAKPLGSSLSHAVGPTQTQGS